MEHIHNIQDLAKHIADVNGLNYDNISPVLKDRIYLKAIIEYLENRDFKEVDCTEGIICA